MTEFIEDDQPQGLGGCHYCWIEGDSGDGVPHLHLHIAENEDVITVPVYELVDWLKRQGAPVTWLDVENKQKRDVKDGE